MVREWSPGREARDRAAGLFRPKGAEPRSTDGPPSHEDAWNRGATPPPRRRRSGERPEDQQVVLPSEREAAYGRARDLGAVDPVEIGVKLLRYATAFLMWDAGALFLLVVVDKEILYARRGTDLAGRFNRLPGVTVQATAVGRADA